MTGSQFNPLWSVFGEVLSASTGVFYHILTHTWPQETTQPNLLDLFDRYGKKTKLSMPVTFSHVIGLVTGWHTSNDWQIRTCIHVLLGIAWGKLVINISSNHWLKHLLMTVSNNRIVTMLSAVSFQEETSN